VTVSSRGTNLLTRPLHLKISVGKFANDETSSLAIELRPTERVLRDKTNSAFDFPLEVKGKRSSSRVVPNESCGIVVGSAGMKDNPSGRHELAFSLAL
jgi:hypothetical protein